MANQILIWIQQRWRLLFVILTPLILLPLPIVHNSLVYYIFFFKEFIFNNFILASKMWLSCTYS